MWSCLDVMTCGYITATHLSQQLPHMFCHMWADWRQKQSLNLNKPHNQVPMHPFHQGQLTILIPAGLQLKESSS